LAKRSLRARPRPQLDRIRALLGFHSGITLFNENGYSGVLFSDVFTAFANRGRIMFLTIKDQFTAGGVPSSSSSLVQPFPLIP
jgi:hypothetical protein